MERFGHTVAIILYEHCSRNSLLSSYEVAKDPNYTVVAVYNREKV